MEQRRIAIGHTYVGLTFGASGDLKVRTGILVHGCHLDTENWRRIVWGDEHQGAFGRLPLAVALAYEFRATTLFFGTAASQKRWNGDTDRKGEVLFESEYTVEFLKSHFARLRSFALLRSRLNGLDSGVCLDELRDFVLARTHIDRISQSTAGEIEAAGRHFCDLDIDRVVLVSSPTHIVRCLRDASEIFQRSDRFRQFSGNLIAAPSLTCYENTTPGNVVVVEPPHIPNKSVISTFQRHERMLQLQQRLNQERLSKLIIDFDCLLQMYEDQEAAECSVAG